VDLGLPIGSLAMLALALVLAGLATGFLSGLLGIGGGGILVPVLYETFGVLGVAPHSRMHMALGTSLAVIAVTSLSSYRAHHARGSVDEALVARLLPWVVLGVVGGVLLARYTTSDGLKWVWVAFGSLMATKLAFGRDDWRLGPDIPKNRIVEVYAAAVGFVSVLLSIGGAAYIVMLMTLYGRPLLQAVATSTGFAPAIGLTGLLGFVWAGWGVTGLPPLSVGYVSLVGAAAIIPTGVLAAPWGARVAHGVSRRTLQLAFAVFLYLVALRFLASLVL